MERDEENGFSYHSARYYAPWLARWTSADPMLEPTSISRYSFVEGNPIRRVDLSGQEGEEINHSHDAAHSAPEAAEHGEEGGLVAFLAAAAKYSHVVEGAVHGYKRIDPDRKASGASASPAAEGHAMGTAGCRDGRCIIKKVLKSQ
jgi:RHS repeat-associated protein